MKRLMVSHAFHSPQMAAMEEAFEQAARQITWAAPKVAIISSVTGRAVSPDEMSTAAYWRRQVRQPVRFQAVMETLAAAKTGRPTVVLEVGPGTTLAGLGQQCVTKPDWVWASSLRQGRGDWAQLLPSLGRLYVAGVDIDWAGFDAPYPRHRVPLPTYPFQRQSFWIDGPETTAIVRDADPATQWEWTREALSRQANQGRLDLNVAAYAERWALLDKITTAYMLNAFTQLGVFGKAGERRSADTLLEAHGIRASYRKLMGRWLRQLASKGLLEKNGEFFTAQAPLPLVSLQDLRAEADRVFAGDRIFLDYTHACGDRLTEILTGAFSPLETLFPGGSFDRAEDIYERSPVSAYFASLSRAALEGFLRAHTRDRLQLLEIGAGTGSTASSLIPILPPDRAIYFFTDVSEIFLRHGERKFAAYPFVRYQRFDISQNVDDQGYTGGSFDVVVATNVLHAVPDIRLTLASVKSLLAPGGILILCEQTDYLSWLDVTTALVEGWQAFDDDLRGDHPLLPSETGSNCSKTRDSRRWPFTRNQAQRPKSSVSTCSYRKPRLPASGENLSVAVRPTLCSPIRDRTQLSDRLLNLSWTVRLASNTRP